MELYDFIDQYVRESFEEERILKTSPRGSVARIRQKSSHRYYIFRRYNGSLPVYFSLLGKECPYLPRIYEAAEGKQSAKDGSGGSKDMLVLEEYVVGDSLSDLLSCGPLTPQQTRRIALQLCRGLYVLHSLGWIHRDIKPDNVIVSAQRAVLIDFDAARTYDHSKTQDTQILGTVGYAPPEQYGISETDYRADIYSMGVLINEMLTCQHPSKQLAGGRWGRIVSRCTMIHPNKRYHSVKELMEAI